MADCVFCAGSAKQASDYITTLQFLINHIKQTFAKGQDTSKALETLGPIDFKALEPTLTTKDLPKLEGGIAQAHIDEINAENDMARMMHQSKLNMWSKREQQHEDNLSTAHATTWSCCSRNMMQKIEEQVGYYTWIKENPIELLRAIKTLSMSYHETKHPLRKLQPEPKSNKRKRRP